MRALLFLLLLALPLTAARPVVEGWHHRVRALYPVEKLKVDEAWPAADGPAVTELSAARGESEPFIVLLRSEVPLRDVTLTAGDWLAPDGSKIDAARTEVRRLGYIFVDEPSGKRIPQPMPYPVGTGLYPDPLLPNRGDARVGHNLQFLVTVRVPREARPGLYEGAVRVQFRKESWMPAAMAAEDVVPVRLKVRGFALPDPSPLLNTSHANLGELPASQQTPEALVSFRREFVSHRQNPEPLVPSPRVRLEKDGSLSVDASAWEAAVSAHFAEGGTHIFLPVWNFFPDSTRAQGLYFLYHYPAVTGQKWFGAPVCAADRTLTADFKRLFGAYLTHMHGVLRRRGWLDRAFIATMDEPYTYHTGDRANDTPENNYTVVRNFVTFVREVAPGLRTFCTADPAEGLNGFIDHWCLRNLEHVAAAKERAEQHGEIVTLCDNYRTFIDYPAISARSLGWLAWGTGARGWLTYETLGSYRTAWEAPVLTYAQFNGPSVWGMGQMFYPDPLSGTPLPSLRWEMMREGCDDYEYLWLLREALKARPDAEAQRLLDGAAAAIVRGGGDAETMAKTATGNATSNLAAHRLREQIAGWIEKLTAEPR